jgi:uncharacterized C2H2 Zn-finger protein
LEEIGRKKWYDEQQTGKKGGGFVEGLGLVCENCLKEMFKCPHCPRAFESEKAVWGHIGRAHRNSEVGKSLGAGKDLDRYADKVVAKLEEMQQIEARLKTAQTPSMDAVFIRAIQHYENAIRYYTSDYNLSSELADAKAKARIEIALARELLWSMGIFLKGWEEK